MGSAVGRPGALRRVIGGRRKGPARQPARQPARAPQELADPAIHEADNPLLTRLREVYVDTSTATVTQDNPFASERGRQRPDNLPQERSMLTNDPYVVTTSSAGFLTFQQAVEILNLREAETVLTSEAVAGKYRIDPGDAENLMKYFSAYRQLTPKQPPSLEG